MVDLTTTELTITELYVIETDNGAIARFTNHGVNIVYDGNTYQSIPIKRTSITYHSELQVDKVTITMGIVGLIFGTTSFTIPQVVKRGFLKNAHVYIYLIDYVALDSVKLIFEGWGTCGVSYNQGELTIGCGSLLDKLNDKFPKFVYSEFCQHKLFDTYCGITKATYLHTGTATAGSTTQIIYASVFAFSNHAQGYWLRGEITFTSGNNDGVGRSIVAHGDGWIRTLINFVDSITDGDTFNVYPGCDKSGSTCESKFSNYDNFFGFETIPKPEVLYG